MRKILLSQMPLGLAMAPAGRSSVLDVPVYMSSKLRSFICTLANVNFICSFLFRYIKCALRPVVIWLINKNERQLATSMIKFCICPESFLGKESTIVILIIAYVSFYSSIFR